MTYTKKMIIGIANEGSAGKSTTKKALAAYLTKIGIPFSKFDADKEHHTFYEAYAARGDNGEIDKEQNSETGCVQIDIDAEPQKIVDTVGAKNDIVLVDTPSRYIQCLVDSFGPDQVQSFFDTFERKGALPYFVFPWTDATKSPLGLAKLYEGFESVDFDGYEDDFVINIIICMNNGLMNSTSSTLKAQALDAYKTSLALEEITNDKRFKIQLVELKTQMTQPSINLLKGRTVQQAMELSVGEIKDPSSETIFYNLIKDGKKIYDCL